MTGTLKLYQNLSLGNNELQNFIVQNLGGVPGTGVVGGRFFYDTTGGPPGVLKYYNGSAWVTLGAGSGDASTNTATSVDNEIALFSGTTGKLLKRGNGVSVGAAKIVAGIISAATLNDVGAPTADFSMNTHKITGLVDPTNPQEAATKAYVDAVAQGLSPKTSVVAMSTTNIASKIGFAAIDGVTPVDGSRVLLTGQTTGAENGIWVTHSGAWTRPTDFATGSNAVGAFTFVEGGTVNGSSGWVVAGSTAVTVDTTAHTWTQFSGAGEITAGAGLTKSGNTLNVVANADNSIVVNADDIQVSTTLFPKKNSGTLTTANGVLTSFAITHGLTCAAQGACQFSVCIAATGEVVWPSITHTSTTVTTLDFGSYAPALNEFRWSIAA